MSAITAIVDLVESVKPDDFVKLRTELDRVEEKMWNRELKRVTAKHRNKHLTDAKIDELVLKCRYV